VPRPGLLLLLGQLRSLHWRLLLLLPLLLLVAA
jgi:hypothetical protein